MYCELKLEIYLVMHTEYFPVASRLGKKKSYRQQSRMNLFFKLPMWSITVKPAQMAFQLPKALFFLACHVAWMIYFQNNTLISNKFVLWINWKHKIMTIGFAFLGVLRLYLWIFVLYLYIKKGKYQKEESDCERHLSRDGDIKEEGQSLIDGKTEKKKKRKYISGVTWWSHT